MRNCVAVLALAVVLVVAPSAVAQNGASSPEDNNASNQLAGTWYWKIKFEGVGIITYVAQFWKDGRMVSYFPSGQAQGGGFADTRTACPGEWRAIGEREYDVTQYCLWSAWDYGMPPDRIRSKLTLSKKGETFAGPFSYEYWDVTTQTLVLEGYGEGHGTRLPIVPFSK
jgi:hypothetical protein